jgi:hypothetical protein
VRSWWLRNFKRDRRPLRVVGTGHQETTEKWTEGMANHQEMSGYWWKTGDASIAIKASHHVLTVITEMADPSLVTQGCVGDKPCLVTINTGEYMTVPGWPRRQPNQRYTLQTVPGEALLNFKEVFLTLTLEQRPKKIWMFIANIMNEFILDLDILRTYDISVNLGNQMLHFEEEVVPLWSPGVGP